MGDYRKGTDHAAAIDERMDLFEKALTKRWRRETADALKVGDRITTGIVRNIYGNVGLDYTANFFQEDIEWHLHRDYCYTLMWARNGQEGSLSAVKCPGFVYPGGSKGASYQHPGTGELIAVPMENECAALPLMEQIASWARLERMAVEPSIPKFQGHDVAQLEAAYKSAKKLREATLAEYADIDISADEHRGLAGGGDLPGVVAKIWSKDGDSRDWWVEWTGLAAEHVKGNFCTSAGPTLINHSIIATALGNLVANRAAIIEAGRNNGLHLIEQATAALGERKSTPVNETEGWKSVENVLDATSLWSALGGPVPKAMSAALKLTQFLGNGWFGELKVHSFAEEMNAIVIGLVDGLLELRDELDESEADYRKAASGVMDAINETASFDLELYDLGENTPGGTGDGGTGYHVDISNVLTLAEHCESAGEQYEELLRHFADLSEAESHLADRDSEPTAADNDVIEIIAELKGFIKTTAARYYMAHQEIRSAAEAYAEVDRGSAAVFERTMDSWERSGVGDLDPGFNVGKAAKPTKRDEDASDNPYNGELEGDPNYYTEKNKPG